MRGHEALIALRRRGVRPVWAFVTVGRDHSESCREWHEWMSAAHIEIQPEDRIQRIDLRCLLGMWVSVSGFDAERVAAAHEACVAASARCVMSAVYERDEAGELVCVDRIETLEAA